MKRGSIAGFLGTTVVVAFSLGAFAEIRDNPYQIIIERNPFALKPIPPPVDTAKKEELPPPVPPLEIKLTGITTLLGPPRVFLELVDTQTKKTERPPPLSEGELVSNTAITILEIDAENGQVRIKNGDAETTLDFKNNGIKPSATASAAPVPIPPLGVPPPIRPPNYGSTPAVVNPALGNLPPRPLRTDNNLGIQAGGGAPYNPNPQPLINQPPPLSRDDAEARIEATRRILEQQNNPQSRIMPPTSLGRALGTPPAPAPVPQ